MNLINWLLNPKCMHFEFSCGNTTQYYFLCIFETFGRMKLKHLILFVFLILIIQNHKKKYKHTPISFYYILLTHPQLSIYKPSKLKIIQITH